MPKNLTNKDARQISRAMTKIMKLVTQSLSQSTALSEILVAKGIVTKKELDEAVKSIHAESKKEVELLLRDSKGKIQ